MQHSAGSIELTASWRSVLSGPKPKHALGREPLPRWLLGIVLSSAMGVTFGGIAVVGPVDRPAVELASSPGDRPVGAAPAPRATRAPADGRGAVGPSPVTFAFGGDIHFEGRIREVLATDPRQVLSGVAPLLSGADVAMANLEAAVTGRGAPADKEFTFRAPPRSFEALAAGGLDLVSMANNHALDYGPLGLQDTLDAARDARFPVVGIGRDATEAFRPWTTTVRGNRIAVLAASHVIDTHLSAAWTATDRKGGLASAYDTERLLAAVRSARAGADTVVVYLHWGTEGATCPNESQPVLARRLVEAGADIVVGGHAHRLQGAGMLGSAFVAYGLGNFAFYRDAGPGTESGVLTVTATGRRIDAASWHPVRITRHLPIALDGRAAATAHDAWVALRECARLEPVG